MSHEQIQRMTKETQNQSYLSRDSIQPAHELLSYSDIKLYVNNRVTVFKLSLGWQYGSI